MFDALGEVRRISGVSGIDYISNTYVNEHRYCGEVRDVGYDTNLNFELLASMRPDLVLLYGVTAKTPSSRASSANWAFLIYISGTIWKSRLWARPNG